MKKLQSMITRVLFSWALPEGLHVECEDGSRDFLTFTNLEDEVGVEEGRRLRKIAYNNGFTGMWQSVSGDTHEG